jgi:transmembrane sensor
MSIDPHQDSSYRQRLEQAGAWRARLAMYSVAASPDFEAWLKEDPRNAQAWEDSRRSWDVFDERRTDPDVVAAVRAARDRARQEQVQRRRGTRSGLGWIAAAVALLVVAGLSAAMLGQPQAFETASGARREVVLTDGSKVSLDAGTLLKVRFSRGRRDLQLVRGQAVFDVAHDSDRPFAVTAGDRRVIATGTRFNIDMLAGTTRITLVEGSVLVEQIGGRTASAVTPRTPERVSLRPGQQLVADASTNTEDLEAQVATVDTSKALAWKGGQLVFDDEPLADVLQRVSRYSDTKVEVRDPSLAARRISGVFIAGDLATFLDAIQQHLSIEAIEVSPGRIELRRTSA